MKKLNHSASKAGLVGALILCLTGCVVYRERPATRTVYVPAPPPPVAAPVVEVQAESDFYEPLRPYGEWVVVAQFGNCWRPSQVEVGWRPYTSGHWRRCDAGWYWASEEPWGWATYHYGRWDWHRRYGWIWVPQTQWAPAWVTWRAGAGYVGWAPIPPSARITVSGAVDVRDVLIESRFVFVEDRRMTHPIHPRALIINDRTVINKTVNITKIKVVNKVVVNEGPHVDVIERASGRKLEAQSVHKLRRQEESEFVARNQKQNGRAAENRNSPDSPRADSAPPIVTSPRDSRGPDKSNDEPMRPRPTPPAKPQERSEPTPVAGSPRPQFESPAPVAGVPARENRKVEKVSDQPTKPRPSVPESPQVRNEPAPNAVSSRPGRGQPARNDRKSSEPLPVAARTQTDPTPKPAVVPAAPAPAEKPVVATRPTPPGHAKHPVNEPGRPTTGPANSSRPAAPADKPADKVSEQPARSPKDNAKSPANEQSPSSGRGRQNKNGEKDDQR